MKKNQKVKNAYLAIRAEVAISNWGKSVDKIKRLTCNKLKRLRSQGKCSLELLSFAANYEY